MDFNKLLADTVEIVKEAGMLLLDEQKKVQKMDNPSHFVTNTDLLSNDLILSRLKKIDPAIPIYSEESGGELGGWIVDPIDGTINFFHQDAFWGVTIALMKDGIIQLAVIFLPALKQLIGVTRNGKVVTEGGIALEVGPDKEILGAQIWTDWVKGSRQLTLDTFSKLAKVNQTPQIRLCSSAAYLAVAAGHISGFVCPLAPIEDMAAGSLIVEKAGGKVTDIKGNIWTPPSTSIVASNSWLHNDLLNAINSE